MKRKGYPAKSAVRPANSGGGGEGRAKNRKPRDFENGVLVDSGEMDPAITSDTRDEVVNRTDRR